MFVKEEHMKTKKYEIYMYWSDKAITKDFEIKRINDCTPEDDAVKITELPDEIFCCGFQSCFFEAVRLRFPEYADAASSLPCMGPG